MLSRIYCPPFVVKLLALVMCELWLCVSVFSRTLCLHLRTAWGHWSKLNSLCWWMSCTVRSCSSLRTQMLAGNVKVEDSYQSNSQTLWLVHHLFLFFPYQLTRIQTQYHAILPSQYRFNGKRNLESLSLAGVHSTAKADGSVPWLPFICMVQII